MDFIIIWWRKPGIEIFSINFAVFTGLGIALNSALGSLGWSLALATYGTLLGTAASALFYRKRGDLGLFYLGESTIYFLPTWCVGVIGLIAAGVLHHKVATDPERQCNQFASALIDGRFGDARRLAEGDEAKQAIDAYERGYNPSYGTVESRTRKVTSVTPSDDRRRLTYGWEQTVVWRPNNASQGNSVTVCSMLTISLLQTRDGWRVESFQEQWK